MAKKRKKPAKPTRSKKTKPEPAPELPKLEAPQVTGESLEAFEYGEGGPLIAMRSFVGRTDGAQKEGFLAQRRPLWQWGLVCAVISAAIWGVMDYQHKAVLSRSGVDLQGHRGARGLAAESTLLSFRAAIDHRACTLEMDVGVTKDDVVVVHHDERLHPDIARLDGEWLKPPTPAIRELTYDVLETYDVGRVRKDSALSKRFPEQRGADEVRIPKLADLIVFAERRAQYVLRYNIETKLSPDAADRTAPPEAFAKLLIDVVEDAGVADVTTIQSFDWRTLKHVQANSDIATACLSSESTSGDTLKRGQPGPSPWTAGLDVDDFASVPELVKAAGCAVWSPRLKDASAATVKKAHDLGLKVAVWTVNEPKDIEAALALGVDAIISDYPDRLRAVANKAGVETICGR